MPFCCQPPSLITFYFLEKEREDIYFLLYKPKTQNKALLAPFLLEDWVQIEGEAVLSGWPI